MVTTLSAEEVKQTLARLAPFQKNYETNYPGEPKSRQPVHTIYGGAHLFNSQTIQKLGQLALKSLADYAPDFIQFHRALQWPGYNELPSKADDVAQLLDLFKTSGPKPSLHQYWLSYTIYERIVAKLKAEAVEDFRIDFEDGFGYRSDEEEDQTAKTAAAAYCEAYKSQSLAPYMGIRIKPLTPTLGYRGLRTLDIFLKTLKEGLNQDWHKSFLITLPKIEYPEQIETFCQVLGQIEQKLGLPKLKIELMIETTQSVFSPDGRVVLMPFVKKCEDRCFAAHFGTYDYTASCDIVSAEQRMDNPLCDFARHHMKLALARTGVFMSDGATNIMPVGTYGADTESKAYISDNVHHIHQAWRLSFSHIKNSLQSGFYQGWDLHPGQIPVRYGAIYHFFLSSLNDATKRLANFIDGAAKATLSGNVFDDAATGQGLLNFFIRAYECQAISSAEFTKTGLTMDDLLTRSFPKILASRNAK